MNIDCMGLEICRKYLEKKKRKKKRGAMIINHVCVSRNIISI